MKTNIDLNRIDMFIKISDAGNITRAAETLNEPKNKLSRNLALLEKELGIQLAYRTTRQFRLTEAGLQFYQSAKEKIEDLNKAITCIKEKDEDLQGLISVTAPDDIGLLVITDIIHDFSKIYPKIQFQIIYSNQMLDLVKLGIDAAIRIGHLRDSSLIQKRCGNLKMVLAASPKYLNKHPMISDINSLVDHKTIGFTNGQNKDNWGLHSHGKRKSLKLKHHISANNYIAARDLALRGHGIAYLPHFLCERHLESGDMIHILKQWGEEGLPIQITMPQQKNVPARVRTFFDFTAKKLSEIF